MSVLRSTVTLLGLHRGPAAALAVMLLATTAGLVAAHVGRRTVGWPSEQNFGLGQEWGYGEVFFAVQNVWAVGLLAWAAVRARMPVLAGWAGAFAVLLVDERLMLHEQAGGLISDRLPAVPHSHVGELVWLVAVAAVVGGVLVVLHLRSDAEGRAVSGVLVLLGAALFAAGVVVDFVHGIADVGALNLALMTAEDGGEVAVMNLVVAFAFAVALLGHRPVFRGRLGRALGVRPAGDPPPGPGTARPAGREAALADR